jgi:hypothetical protein
VKWSFELRLRQQQTKKVVIQWFRLPAAKKQIGTGSFSMQAQISTCDNQLYREEDRQMITPLKTTIFKVLPL